jgi:hypothetical protein
MRKLLRSISPFSKRNVTVNDPGPSVPVGQTTTKPTWSLHGTDFHKVLYLFYSKYNPDKISAIDEILMQYSGEEMVMLFELSEVYKLSQSTMQKLIDDSKNIDIDMLSTSSADKTSQAPSPAPVEYKSVVTPQWANGKASPDRVSHRTMPSGSNKHKKSGDLNPYRPKSDVASVPKRVPPQVVHSRESDRDRDSLGSEDTPRVTPMSLQEIINTSRKNDSLMKKSVRFSPNLELSGEVSSSAVSSSYYSLGAHRTSSSSRQPQLNGDSNIDSSYGAGGADVNERGDHITAAQSQALPRAVLNVAPIADLSYPTHTGEQLQLQRPASTASLVSNSTQPVADLSSNQEPEDNSHHSLYQHRSEPTLTRHTAPAPTPAPTVSPVAETPRESSRVRTESIGLEEMRRELERTRQALSQADNERHEVLNLLQEVVAAPFEMQEVVERYLDNYGTISSRSFVITRHHLTHYGSL